MKPRPEAELVEFARAFRAAHAQDTLGAIASSVLVDNERVRIWELVLAPGEASSLHRHELDYVIVLLEGDRIAAVPAPGSTRGAREAAVTPGRAIYLTRGDTEWAVNTGSRPYRELLIELKPRI
jgi:hypothetical protein